VERLKLLNRFTQIERSRQNPFRPPRIGYRRLQGRTYAPRVGKAGRTLQRHLSVGIKNYSDTNYGDRDENIPSLEPSCLFPFDRNLKNWTPEQIIMSSTKLFDLCGRVAVVTGGNGGIGRGFAIRL
jgi:hypothetical protein